MTLAQWLQDARESLKVRAAEDGRPLRERDFQRAMEMTRRASPRSVPLAHFPGVGPVDLMNDSLGAVELKWCNSGDTLCNSAWDVAKLATLLAEGRVDNAWIAAGAPVAHWRSGAPGVELFERTSFDGDAIVRRYESWWRSWCGAVLTRPTHLPEGIAVTETISVPVRLDSKPFELRAGRVEVTDSSWRPHVCPHVWRAEPCHPR